MKIITFASAILLATQAQAQDGAAALDRAVTAYSRMKTARADFRQTLTNPLTGSTHNSRGVLLRKQPNLLSIRFDGPQGDRVVSDGKAVWFYSPSSAPGQVMKLASKDGRVATVDPGSQLLSSPRTKYNVTAHSVTTLDGRRVHLVSLAPKSRNGPFSTARIWIDDRDASVRQFETVDASGLTRLVRITGWQPNVTIPASSFRFTPPPNVKIVDQASLTGR